MMMKFDVFVSFREIDTRRTFVSHLLLSLLKNHVNTYKHEKEIPNHPPSAEVLLAIDKSKAAIVVISKNYAASICCLDELAKIIECKEKRSLVVVPVFYEVDPADVIRQVDDHLGDHNNLEKVKRWRDAMEKSIQIYDHQDYSHWEDEDSYSNIIDKVTSYVSHCLSVSKTVSEEEHSTDGYEEEKLHHRVVVEPCSYARIDIIPEECRRQPHKEADSSSLRNCFPYIILLFIKLVRAAFRKIAGRVMYEEKPSGDFVSVKEEDYVIGHNLSRLILSENFNSFVGMDRIMKEVYTLLDLESRDRTLEIGILGERGVGKTTLARCVYEQISPWFQDYHYFIENTKNCSQKEEFERFNEVMKATLGHRKVLLIIDDVDSRKLDHIRKLAPSFGPGSRLIFVIHHQELKCRFQRHYIVESLRYDEALQLFSQCAFKQEQVPREYHRLSVRAVTVTGRIPLALKLFGSFLCGKLISEWESELCRLEAPKCKWDCVAKVSNYIGNALS